VFMRCPNCGAPTTFGLCTMCDIERRGVQMKVNRAVSDDEFTWNSRNPSWARGKGDSDSIFDDTIWKK
ncbi:hypothetical protein ACFL43_07610, partial [Thermodesulfobacteriota bacterium]